MSVDRVLVEKNIEIPMRDGVLTYADLYRPADGGPVPGIVTRTPYDKEVFGAAALPIMPAALKLAERGYAVVVQDTRGRFASEGDFDPFRDEGPDGPTRRLARGLSQDPGETTRCLPDRRPGRGGPV